MKSLPTLYFPKTTAKHQLPSTHLTKKKCWKVPKEQLFLTLTARSQETF